MPPAENAPGQLLLVGPPAAEPIRRMRRQAETGGWSVRQASDGFEALEAVIGDSRLEAVLVPAEEFHPRVAALARSLGEARPDLPIYLVCPAWLEPEARQIARGQTGVDYLVDPLGPRDWASIRGRHGGPGPDDGPALADATPRSDLSRLEELLEQTGGSSRQLLGAAAAWASARLSGRTVRVRWAAESAKYPPDGPDPHAGRTYPLSITSGRAHGELVVWGDGADAASARQVAGPLGRILLLRDQLAEFRRMAYTDHLSGAYNRRYLMLSLERLIERARREDFRITLLMFDIDDFKRYNDTYGHSVGDEIIVDVARLMRQTSRPHDVVARIGGDEFAVLFWDAGPPRQPGSRHPSEAQGVANRFRRALASHRFRSLGPEARGTLTISGGLAGFPRDAADPEGLLAVAAGGLKAAKRSGKNRIYLVGREPGDAARQTCT